MRCALLLVVLLPSFAAHAADSPRPPVRTDAAEILMVRPKDRGGFGPKPIFLTSYPAGKAGLEAMHKVLLDADASDEVREETFYHLSLRGKDVAPVLLDLVEKLKAERRWEWVIVRTMEGVPDRRLIPTLLRTARDGSDPITRAGAVAALSTCLLNRAPVRRMVTNADGSVTYSSTVRMMSCGPIRSHGELLQPGDEKPIVALYRELKGTTDPHMRRSLQSLEWSVTHLDSPIPSAANGPPQAAAR